MTGGWWDDDGPGGPGADGFGDGAPGAEGTDEAPGAERLRRWRLLLGEPAAAGLGAAGRLGPAGQAADGALTALYDAGPPEHGRPRSAGLGASRGQQAGPGYQAYPDERTHDRVLHMAAATRTVLPGRAGCPDALWLAVFWPLVRCCRGHGFSLCWVASS